MGSLLLTAVPLTQAANQTWQGDVSNTWETGGNWSGGSQPGNTDTAFFNDSATTTTPTATASLFIGTINLSGSTAFTFNNSGGVTYFREQAIALTSTSSATQTFNGPAYRAFRLGDSTFTNNGTGLIDFNTGILKEDDFSSGTNGDTGRLIFNGTGDFEVESVGKRHGHLQAGLRKEGAGTLTIKDTVGVFSTSGNDSSGLTDTIYIDGDGGTLRIEHVDALGTGNITLHKHNFSTGTLELALTGTNTFDNTFNSFRSSQTLASGGTANILNTSGDNTITSDLTITSAGGIGVNIVSDGGLLTLAGDISTGFVASRRLTLSGTGEGVVTGNILDGGTDRDMGVWKYGSGIWTLSGTKTYTNETTVYDGTLQVDGSIASSSMTTVNTGGTLSGNGVVGPLTLQGGTLSPGASVGTISAGNTIWSDGSSFLFEIDDAAGTAGPAGGPGWDLLDITGTLDISGLSTGGFTINIDTLLTGGGTNPGDMANFVDGGSYDWEFVRTTGGLVGAFEANDFLLDTSGVTNAFTGAFSVSNVDNSLFVTYSPRITGVIPEPSTFLIWAVGLLGLAWYARRRRTK